MSSKGPNKNTRGEKPSKSQSVAEVYAQIIQLAALDATQQPQALQAFKEANTKYFKKPTHFKRLFTHLKTEIGFGQGDEVSPNVVLDILDQDISLCRFFLLNLWPDEMDNTSKDELVIFLTKGYTYWLNLTLGHLKGCSIPSGTYASHVDRVRYNSDQLELILPHYERMLKQWVKNPGRDTHKKRNKQDVAQLFFKPIKCQLILQKLLCEDSSETIEALARLTKCMLANKTLQKYLEFDDKRYQQWIQSFDTQLKKYASPHTDTIIAALARTLRGLNYYIENEFTLEEDKLTPKHLPETFDIQGVTQPVLMALQSIESTPVQIMDMPLKTICISAPYLIANPEPFEVKTYITALKALELYQTKYLIGKHPLIEMLKERLNLLSDNIKQVLEAKMGIQKKPSKAPSTKAQPPSQEKAVQVLTIPIKPEDIPFKKRSFEQQLIDAPRSKDSQKRKEQCMYVMQTHQKKLKNPKFMARALEELERYCAFIDNHVEKRSTQEGKLRLINEAINTLHFFIEDIVPCAQGFETASASINAHLIYLLDKAIGLSCALYISPEKPKDLPSPKKCYESLLDGAANKYFVALALITQEKLHTDTQRLMTPSFFKSGIALIRALQSMAVSCNNAPEQLGYMQKAQAAHDFVSRHLKAIEGYDLIETEEGKALNTTFEQQKFDIEQQITMLTQQKKPSRKPKSKQSNKPYKAELVEATPEIMRELMAEPMFFGEDDAHMAQITQAMAAFALENRGTKIIAQPSREDKASSAQTVQNKPKIETKKKEKKENTKESKEDTAVDEAAHELSQLRLEVSQLKDAVQMQEKNEIATDMHVRALEEDNAALKKELAQTERARKKAQSSLDSVSQRHRNLIQTHDKVVETSRSRKETITSLKSQLQKKDARIEELLVDQQELEEMQDKALQRDSKLQTKLLSEQRHSEKLAKKIQSTKEYAEGLAQQLEDAKAMALQAEENLASLKDQHEAQTQALVKTLQKNKALSRQLQQPSSETQELTSSLQQQVLLLQQKLAQEQALRLEEEQQRKAAQARAAQAQKEVENAEQIIRLFSPKPMEKSQRIQLLESQEEAFKTSVTLKVSQPLVKKVKKIQALMTQLEGSEDKAYIDGGFLRCQLTGIEHSDIDLITTRSQQWIKENCDGFVQNVHIPWLFTNYSDPNCHIDLVSCPELDLKQQASLRDLSCNALFANKSLEIMDPLGCGLSDIHQQRLNVIGDPCERFKEDPKRIFRMIRFWCELRWPLERESMFAAKIYSKNLKTLPYNVYIKNLSTLFDKPLYAFHAVNQLDILSEMFGFAELDSAKHNPTLISYWNHELSKGLDHSVIGLFLLHPYLMRQQMTPKDIAPDIIEQFFAPFKNDPYFNHQARFEKIKQSLIEDLYHYTRAYSAYCQQQQAAPSSQQAMEKQCGKDSKGEHTGPSSRTYTPGHQAHKQRARSASPKLQHHKKSSSGKSSPLKKNNHHH